jgi:hypothetical protein
MVAMPYILVNIVLDRLSIIIFCITSAALLYKHPFAKIYLPAQLKSRHKLSFAVHTLFIAVLSVVTAQILARAANKYSLYIFDIYFCIGFINSAVLVYRFLDRRYFLHRPRIQRRLIIGALSVAMISILVIAVDIVVIALFIIK